MRWRTVAPQPRQGWGASVSRGNCAACPSDFSYETLYAVVDSRWAPARVRTAAQGKRSRAHETGDEYAAATQMGSNTVGGCPS
jgi:hypothetical protein